MVRTENVNQNRAEWIDESFILDLIKDDKRCDAPVKSKAAPIKSMIIIIITKVGSCIALMSVKFDNPGVPQ